METEPAQNSFPVPPPLQKLRKTRTRYNPEELAEGLAERFLQRGQIGIPQSPKLKPPTDHDRDTFVRVTGQTVEAFNRNLSDKLREVSDLALLRIREALEADRFKPAELGFVLSVSEDKRARLDGNQAIHSATVNVQVNNYNGSGNGSGPDRAQLMAMLEGSGSRAGAEPGQALSGEQDRNQSRESFPGNGKDLVTVGPLPDPPGFAQAAGSDAQLPAS